MTTLEDGTSTPAKKRGAFVPSRMKQLRYLRGDLIKIRDKLTPEQWLELAKERFGDIAHWPLRTVAKDPVEKITEATGKLTIEPPKGSDAVPGPSDDDFEQRTARFNEARLRRERDKKNRQKVMMERAHGGHRDMSFNDICNRMAALACDAETKVPENVPQKSVESPDSGRRTPDYWAEAARKWAESKASEQIKGDERKPVKEGKDPLVWLLALVNKHKKKDGNVIAAGADETVVEVPTMKKKKSVRVESPVPVTNAAKHENDSRSMYAESRKSFDYNSAFQYNVRFAQAWQTYIAKTAYSV